MRVETALQEAWTLDAADRPRFVAAIPDAEIRGEVESLLAADNGRIDIHLEQAIAATANRVIDGRLRNSPFGNYRFLDLLGSGGMGDVYLAEDLRQDRKVALKLLPPGFSEEPSRVRRFEREGRAASALRHPNIVTVYEIGETDGRWFIALEYVEGEPLSARIARGPIPTPEVLRIADQVAAALSHTHQAGILHRDVKPANIMLRPDGVVKLVDFGVARLDPVLFEGGQSTHAGRLLGTPTYMSPEQAQGLPLTDSTDLFSLGAVLYEMVTGTQAFRDSDSSDVLTAILSRPPVPPSQKAPSIPRELDLLIMKLLSRNPAARCASAQEVRLAIERIQTSLAAGTSWRSRFWPNRLRRSN
ncbi:MAG TPA: serine/threonine-protein kinase [Bryobacteraceae bacterium]|nr:serine/threonine-protein kinase [Bryobacteraceae bacterium]